MVRNITILIVILFITLTAKGQNLFFIGEHSYPCSESFTLESDSDKFYINDLSVLFAKNGKTALIAISTETQDVLIKGKLIIYLNDGTVITLTDKVIFDYVNKVASTVYNLTNEELDKMKAANINTIRYSLENEYGDAGTFGGDFSASNSSKIDFPALLSEFFEE